MTKDLQPLNFADSSPVLSEANSLGSSLSMEALAKQNENAQKAKRSLGLKLVDTLVYPIINNFGVFAISVGATYLTHRGWPENASGKPLAPWKREVGEWFHRRGQNMDNLFMNKLNMNEGSAKMARTVFFSFADGTLLAPFVKILEDRRERTAKWIDDRLGHKHEEHVYKAEPKQTWGSVIEGRLLTSLIVVPTAVALDKINPGGVSLNDRLFNNPGKAFGEKVETQYPKLKNKLENVFGKIDKPYFFSTVAFEIFYTSVCTAGLYFISRAIANHRKQAKEHKLEALESQNAPLQVGTDLRTKDLAPAKEQGEREATTEQNFQKPSTHVSQTTHQLRVSAAPAQEITA